jgi:hypothetical protein
VRPSPGAATGFLRTTDISQSPALQDAARGTMISEMREASWTAPALWRFAALPGIVPRSRGSMREFVREIPTPFGRPSNARFPKTLPRRFQWNECLRPPSPFILSPRRENRFRLFLVLWISARPVPSYQFSKARGTIPPLLGETAGVRADVITDFICFGFEPLNRSCPVALK